MGAVILSPAVEPVIFLRGVHCFAKAEAVPVDF
jgi:hypothetical protein